MGGRAVEQVTELVRSLDVLAESACTEPPHTSAAKIGPLAKMSILSGKVSPAFTCAFDEVQMDIPKSTWGRFDAGDREGSKVIVEAGEKGGWDILLFPPPPSDDVWNYWASDEADLHAWFTSSEELREMEDRPWVNPGELDGVTWDGIALAPDDKRMGPPSHAVIGEPSMRSTFLIRWWKSWINFGKR
jgi:hypothetical protein